MIKQPHSLLDCLKSSSPWMCPHPGSLTLAVVPLPGWWLIISPGGRTLWCDLQYFTFLILSFFMTVQVLQNEPFNEIRGTVGSISDLVFEKFHFGTTWCLSRKNVLTYDYWPQFCTIWKIKYLLHPQGGGHYDVIWNISHSLSYHFLSQSKCFKMSHSMKLGAL